MLYIYKKISKELFIYFINYIIFMKMYKDIILILLLLYIINIQYNKIYKNMSKSTNIIYLIFIFFILCLPTDELDLTLI